MASPRPIKADTAYSRMLQLCRRCGRETAHEVQSADGINVKVCLRCVERAMLYELDRD